MLPTLNIILYTDHPELFHEDPLEPEGGLIDLQAFIREKTKQFVKVNFELVRRHGADSLTGVELHGEKMITDQLLENAHELWVFGRRMANSDGEPHNELELKEIEILENLMGPERRIGILVTGDHSESPEKLSCESDRNDFLSLGRALGKDIPLAGLLRDWEGPPTNCIELPFEQRDNVNTQEPGETTDLDTEFLEGDENPQILVPNAGEPHRLFQFIDADGELREIKNLPDHAHEGIVFGPDDLADVWPADLPHPVVAARGKDKRFTMPEKISNLVVAVDGDLADAGRIVVDSSFHHFLDENLRKIPSRNAVSKLPEPGSPLDQIAHFFGNLTLWLAPKPIRDKIKFDILLSLARHNTVLEALSLSHARVGRVARHVLKTTIGPGRLRWLFGPSAFEKRDIVDDFFALIFLSDEQSFPFMQIITPDQLLGIVIKSSNRFLAKHRIADATRITQHKELWHPLLASLHIALESAQTEFSDRATSNQSITEKELKGEKEMAFRCKVKWRSFVNEAPIGILDVRQIDLDGKIKGKHVKSAMEEVDFEGHCTETPHHINLTTHENFEFDGDIFEAGADRFAVGTRSKFTIDKDGKRKKLNGDEVWVGVKTSD